MNELISILNIQIEKYPKLQVSDLIKLIYQNEMGVGHLLKDDYALSYLQSELKENITDLEICYIGNDMYRVPINYCSPSDLVTKMVASAKLNKGRKEILKEKLEYVANNLAFPNLEKEINEYIELGMPLIHHSNIYRISYNPHYRLIHKNYL